MSHAGDPTHHPQPVAHDAPPPPPHAGPGQPLFPEAEVKNLRTADKLAAGWIVGLMGGIFSVGVVLYIIVFWSVLEAPQWWAPAH